MSITIQTTSGSVDLVPMYDGYAKSISKEGPAVEIKYIVPWDKSDAVANALMGLNSSMSVAGTIVRTLSHICPASPNLVCLAIGKIEGIGEVIVNDGGVPQYESAIVPVTYGVPSYGMSGTDASGNTYNNIDSRNLLTPDQRSYEFCTFTFDYSVEVLSHLGTEYKFTGAAPYGGQSIGHPFGITIFHTKIGCSVKKVPWLPSNEIFSLQGCVNNALFFGRDRGSILFEGAKTSIAKAQDGTTLSVDIDLTFNFRDPPWNQAPVPGDGSDWRTITHNGQTSIYDGGSGIPPYPEVDLRPLIFGVQFPALDFF